MKEMERKELNIGERISKLMKEKKLNQKELANQINVTEASMSRYLKNEREPKVEIISKLAKALNTTTDYLINGTSEKYSFDTVMNIVVGSKNYFTNAQKYEIIKEFLA